MKLRIVMKCFRYKTDEVFEIKTCDIEVPKDKEQFFNSFTGKDNETDASIIGTEVLGDTANEYSQILGINP